MEKEKTEQLVSQSLPAKPTLSRWWWLGIAVIMVVVGFLLIRGSNPQITPAAEEENHHQEEAHGGSEVLLSPEVEKAARIEIESISGQPEGRFIRTTGSVEANQLQTQQVSAQVSGRLEQVRVTVGMSVKAGMVLAELSSPLVAEMHGKLHEAETQLGIAQRNYERVQKVENRISLLQARARLDEAQANLTRTQKLIELGAGAGKDLIAAETAYQNAKAEFDFQNNINLSREVQEAKAALESAQLDVDHKRNGLKAVGGVSVCDTHSNEENTALVPITAPVSGIVTERLVNAGVGIEPGKPLFTITNLSSVWVITNIPVAEMLRLTMNSTAVIRPSNPESLQLTGKVTYLDPLVNETTRTARVRVEVDNPGNTLRIGMFVNVELQTADDSAGPVEIVIPAQAVQRMGEQSVVFLPKADEAGAYEVREVEVGEESSERVRITAGLQPGEKIVVKGAFTLKTQLMKGELGGHDD